MITNKSNMWYHHPLNMSVTTLNFPLILEGAENYHGSFMMCSLDQTRNAIAINRVNRNER